jgi:hypothetical protein
MNIEKHEYEVINTITKDDIARVGDASIFVEESCGILKAMIEDDGKDISLYLLTCVNMEETFDYLTYRVYAEQVFELRNGEKFPIKKE